MAERDTSLPCFYAGAGYSLQLSTLISLPITIFLFKHLANSILNKIAVSTSVPSCGEGLQKYSLFLFIRLCYTTWIFFDSRLLSP